MMNLGMEHGIAVLHVSGLLAKSDYAEVLPQLEHQIESQDKPRVMVVPAGTRRSEEDRRIRELVGGVWVPEVRVVGM